MPVSSTPLHTVLVAALLCAGAEAAEPVDFAREVRPVLERACIQCHGPDKQKGKLRLDSADALEKGGENGAPVVAGQPGESDFLRRITLPAGHEDVMPPRGKVGHLSAAEIDLVRRWIAEGAAWPKGMVAIASKADGAASIGPLPEAAELEARVVLGKLGVRVRPLAEGVHWVRVSFRSVTGEWPDSLWKQVALITNTVELDLSGTVVTDDQLAGLSGLANLANLNLAQTPITDAGLEHLAKLPKLTTLNLYGTRVTDAGLAKLSQLPQLKQLYLAATGVTAGGVANLQASHPALKIDDGRAFADLAAPAAKAP